MTGYVQGGDMCLQLWCKYSVSGQSAACHMSQTPADGTTCSPDGMKVCDIVCVLKLCVRKTIVM